MRTIVSIETQERHKLICTFSDNVRKIADISPFLISEVFKPLNNQAIFKTIENKGYYVSWLNEQIDLSADTLWHIGVDYK